jgi:type IV pilus assembly protein PilC
MSQQSAMARALARRAPQTQVSSHRIPAKTLAVFTRQWSALMSAGIPLVQAFGLLSQGVVGSARTQQSLKQIVDQLQQDVNAGCSLYVAFQKHPSAFDSLYCSLLQAGESAGILDKLLNRLADTLEANLRLKDKVQNALIYPACILVVAAGVVMVIMVWVIPMFEEVFQSLGAALPLATRLLMLASHWAGQWGLFLFLSMACTIFICLRVIQRSPALQWHCESMLCAVPVLGPLAQSNRTSRWAQTLSALLEAGIPISEALGPAAASSGSVQLQTIAAQLVQHIQEGSALNVAMSKSKLFPTVLIQMSAIGEETGTLPQLLEKAAQLMVADLNQHILQLTTLLEPMLMVLLGLVIGGILIALYLPIFSLGQVF